MRAFFLTICFCIAFVLVGPAQDPGRRSLKKKVSSGVLLHVTALKLSHTEISSTCMDEVKDCSSDTKVEVASTATYSETGLYVYKISAGKIIGSGANVIWDLSAVPPGEYTITAGIDMGKPWGVVGMTQTKRVRVLDCMGCKSEEVKTPENK